MKDFGLVGNGRSAAPVDPWSRIVWWCYPRFDGDPIFSRLVAGGEEKGFCDVVLDDMVNSFSDYVRTAIVSTVLTNNKGASIRNRFRTWVCDAVIAQLGGPILARLVLVSNRVSIPKSRATRSAAARYSGE